MCKSWECQRIRSRRKKKKNNSEEEEKRTLSTKKGKIEEVETRELKESDTKIVDQIRVPLLPSSPDYIHPISRNPVQSAKTELLVRTHLENIDVIIIISHERQ